MWQVFKCGFFKASEQMNSVCARNKCLFCMQQCAGHTSQSRKKEVRRHSPCFQGLGQHTPGRLVTVEEGKNGPCQFRTCRGPSCHAPLEAAARVPGLLCSLLCSQQVPYPLSPPLCSENGLSSCLPLGSGLNVSVSSEEIL